ncbi:hypothetical protein [Macrococcus capreoli]|uniref:hypothetical protein n=1 Tax=Macrococcus capreoli TaxID=2982690 RepID=UPI003EE6961D
MKKIELKTSRETLKKFGLEDIEVKAIMQVIEAEIQSELLNDEVLKENEKQKQKDEKTDKQKRDEILAIKNDTKRIQEIAQNLHLFGGAR